MIYMASFEKRGSKWRFKIHYNDNLGRKNILVNQALERNKKLNALQQNQKVRLIKAIKKKKIIL